jgi:hypothetical protein
VINRNLLHCLLAFSLGLTASLAGAQPQNMNDDPEQGQGPTRTIIHAGTLLATPGEKPRKEMTVVISDGRIEAVHKGYRSHKDLGIQSADYIELRDAFVLPGLIDMHTHITGERDPEANPHRWTTLRDGDFVLESLPYLERTLMAGFTTVRNVGAPADVILPLKAGIEKGLISGPRIVAGVSPPPGGTVTSMVIARRSSTCFPAPASATARTTVGELFAHWSSKGRRSSRSPLPAAF